MDARTLSTLFFALGMAAAAAFCLLAVLYRRRERNAAARMQRHQADIADLTILFQTMRDIIGQQKTLAKSFNQELDKKMAVVKQILGKSIEKNERLFERQQALIRELDESRELLRGLQREVAVLREHIGRTTPLRAAGAPPPIPAQDDPPRAAFGSLAETPGTRVAVRPAGERPAMPPPGEDLSGTGVRRGDYLEWVRADFAELDNLTAREPAPAPPPEEPMPTPRAPEDGDAARRAFRALLDLEPGDPAAPPPVSPKMAAEAPIAASRAAPAGGANGGILSPSLQARVLEYHDAGMPVSEIARELGLGKGEIRLMLSLARQPRP